MLIRKVHQAANQLRDLERDALDLTSLQVMNRVRSIRKLLERALARQKQRTSPGGDE